MCSLTLSASLSILRNGLARSNGYCQLIHSRHPPGSPSDTRRIRRPSQLADRAVNLFNRVESDAAHQDALYRESFRGLVSYRMRFCREFVVRGAGCDLGWRALIIVSSAAGGYLLALSH